MDPAAKVSFSYNAATKNSLTCAGSLRQGSLLIDGVAKESFSCIVAASGFGATLRNLNLRILVALNRYVELKDLPGMFIEKKRTSPAQVALATITNAIAIAKLLKTNIPALENQDLPTLLTRTYSFFKDHATIEPSTYMDAALVFGAKATKYKLHVEDAGDANVPKKWHVSLISIGGSTTTINTLGAEKVTKFFRIHQAKKQNEEITYQAMQAKQEALLQALDKEDPLTKFLLVTTFTNEERTISVYNANNTTTSITGFISHAPAFKEDWTSRSFNQKQLPSICAQIVQESKHFITHGIFHLEVKPANILYKERSQSSNKEAALQATHTDFLDAVNTNTSNWKNEPLLFTPMYTCTNDILALSNNQLNNQINPSLSPEQAKQIMTGMHIFQLGVAIYQTATGILPYSLQNNYFSCWNSSWACQDKLQDIPTLRQQLKDSPANFTDHQIEIIIKMLSFDYTKRPSINETSTAFPQNPLSAAVVTDSPSPSTGSTATAPSTPTTSASPADASLVQQNKPPSPASLPDKQKTETPNAKIKKLENEIKTLQSTGFDFSKITLIQNKQAALDALRKELAKIGSAQNPNNINIPKFKPIKQKP